MPQPRLATLCLCASAADTNSLRRRLDDLLQQVPPGDVELRLGLARESPPLHFVLGRLCSDGDALEHTRLPGGVERFRGVTSSDLPFCCWAAPPSVPEGELLRWLWCDLPLATEYVVRLVLAEPLQAVWWPELSGQLASGADIVGQLTWHDLLPAEVETLGGRPRCRGVPWRSREGRPGVWAVGGSWAAYRVESLRQAGLLDAWSLHVGGAAPGRLAVWLGAMARQLGWRQHPDPVEGDGLLSPDLIRG